MGIAHIPGGIAIMGSQTPSLVASTTALVLNAAGEYIGLLGEVYIQGGSGTKTISAAGGGSIIWKTFNPITFADAGTTFRLGIQDVAATGFQDGTFDVSADLVGATDIIVADTIYNTPMGNGTKTITHGDTIALVLECISQAGADAIRPSRQGVTGEFVSNFSGRFWGSNNTGVPVLATTAFHAFIVFDDGTTGWILGTGGFLNQQTSMAVNTGTTPDEVCSAFTPSFRMEIGAIGLAFGAVVAGDTYEIILYEDPGGTPNALITITPDEDQIGSTALSDLRMLFSIPPTILEPGIQYGIALRPTSANSISYNYINYTADGELAKTALPFGTTSLVMGRDDQTGPFVTLQTYYAPKFYLGISGLEDGQSAGGGLKLVGVGGLAG